MSTESRVSTIPFVTVPEVARRRGVSRVAVFYAIRTGRLRAYRPEGGRDLLIKVADAEEYVRAPVRGRAA